MSARAGTPSLAARIVAAVVGGLACSAAFPPAEVWPLAFVALAPLLWALRGVRPRTGALLGLLWGIACFGATLYWIARFGGNAWLALTLLCASFVALFGLIAPAIIRRRRWRSLAKPDLRSRVPRCWSGTSFPMTTSCWGR